jgi:putative hydrolase of the HAD superfamily
MIHNTSTGVIRALLFDLGGVVIDFDFNRVFRRWAEISGRRFEHIRSRFQFDHCFEAFERGEIGAVQYFDALRRTLGIDISDQAFEEGWNRVYIGEIPGMADVLRHASKKLPLYALTNSNRIHKAFWSRRYAPTLRLFRQVFNSSDLGARKPEPEIFRIVADAMGLEPGAMVFYDDFAENIAGARQAGFHAVHVTSTADVVDSLNAIFNRRMGED